MSEEEFVFALATLLVAVILATFQITWEIAKAVFQKDDPRTDNIPRRKKKKCPPQLRTCAVISFDVSVRS